MVRAMAVKLDIRHLQLLVALDQYGTVTAAARALGLTQPALSHQIREAERRVGVPLFRRVKKRLLFTWQGQELLQSARLVVAELERAEADLGALRRNGQRDRAPGDPRLLPLRLARRLPRRARGRRGRHRDRAARRDPVSALRGARQRRRRPRPRRRAACGAGACAWCRPSRTSWSRLVAAVDPRASRPFLEAADLTSSCYVTYSTVLEGGLEHELLFRGGGRAPERYQRAAAADAMAALSRRATASPSPAAGSPATSAPLPIAAVPLTAAGLRITWSVVLRADHAPGQPALVVAERLAAWLAAHAGGTASIISNLHDLAPNRRFPGAAAALLASARPGRRRRSWRDARDAARRAGAGTPRAPGACPSFPGAPCATPIRPSRSSGPTRSRRSTTPRSTCWQEIGMEILLPRRATSCWPRGADVEADGTRVRFDRGMIEAMVAKAPAEFTVHARNPARSVAICRRRHHQLCAVGGPPNATDLDRGRRSGNLADYAGPAAAWPRCSTAIHMAAAAPCWSRSTCRPNIRHLDMHLAFAHADRQGLVALRARRRRDPSTRIEMVRDRRAASTRRQLLAEPSLLHRDQHQLAAAARRADAARA